MRTARIDDICEFVLDGTHGSPVRTETGIAVLSAQNVKNGQLNFDTDRYTSTEEHERFHKRLPLKAGDVLLTIVGTIGRAAVLSEVRPLVFQRSVAVIRPNADAVTPRFLFHATQTREFQSQLLRSANQSSQAGVYLGKLKDVRVPVPPLAEQRRIAEVLDRADALRAKRRGALAQLDTLTQAIFLDLFGDPASNPKSWPEQNLGDLLLSIRNGSSAKQRIERGGWPITRIETIADGTINPKRVRWIEPDDSVLNFQLQAGDILFSHINSVDHISKTALYTGHPARLIHGINLLRLRPDLNVVDPVWLLCLLRHPVVRIYFRIRCKRAVNQASLNQQDIKRLDTYLPPLPLQHAFARRVAAVEKLKATHRASLTELDALFASLQHRAFRGEL